nr:hypothetical protein [bacterium]
MTIQMKSCGRIINEDGSPIPKKYRRGCKAIEDYPKCYFKDAQTGEKDVGAVKSEDGWDGVRRITITDRKKADGKTVPWIIDHDPTADLPAGHRNPTLEDLHFITKQQLGFTKDSDGLSKFNIICRSNLQTDPNEPYKFFFAKSYFSDHASKVLFKNEYSRLENGEKFYRGEAFALDMEEGRSLVAA